MPISSYTLPSKDFNKKVGDDIDMFFPAIEDANGDAVYFDENRVDVELIFRTEQGVEIDRIQNAHIRRGADNRTLNVLREQSQVSNALEGITAQYDLNIIFADIPEANPQHDHVFTVYRGRLTNALANEQIINLVNRNKIESNDVQEFFGAYEYNNSETIDLSQGEISIRFYDDDYDTPGLILNDTSFQKIEGNTKAVLMLEKETLTFFSQYSPAQYSVEFQVNNIDAQDLRYNHVYTLEEGSFDNIP